MNSANWELRQNIIRALIALNLLAMGYMGFRSIEPFFVASSYDAKQSAPQLSLPNLDLKAWSERPVLEEGRVKPMQTVAIETVRLITGRARFQEQKAMPLFLSWIFYDPQAKDSKGIDWDNYEFILCEDHDLRAEIFNVKPSDPDYEKKVHSKYISPWQLYRSDAFQRLIVAVDKKRKEDGERFNQNLDTLERKAHAVEGRLNAYQELTGRLSARDPGQQHASRDNRSLRFDPVHYVALDRVKNSAWFSMGELKYITTSIRAPRLGAEENANLVWQEFMSDRVALQPRLYMDKASTDALQQLQQSIKDGKADVVVSELKTELASRIEKTLPKLAQEAAQQQYEKLGLSKLTDAQVQEVTAQQGKKMTMAELKQTILTTLTEQVKRKELSQNEETIKSLREQLSNISKPYVPEDPKYNQIYMQYLEARYPEMYLNAIKSQPVPLESIKTTLAAYQNVAAAYRVGEASPFQQATQAFFDTVDTVSKQYAGPDFPGETTTALELTLNRVEPFKWAWISMLLSAILFALSLRLESPILYKVAFLPMLVSLGFQIFAYYGRVTISGRPPVSNMFETVIFVASMGAVFAMVLEFFYRNTIIILSGAIIGTLGMIMADQLPYGDGFDAKIKPLVPVLRSNYWLIIHVMTIVASYAAGALAWAIGNISLIMYWFNSDRRDLLKTMANLCYSAIKVAVLLLGVGTLLGGIWAAESWGRFWGWDPKETWALIALVVYLIPLHARYIGWVKDFGMAVASVVCFAGIVMSWYGVNFIIPAGLHSYGVGEGGAWQVFLLGSINLMWVLLVCHRRASMELKGTPQLA